MERISELLEIPIDTISDVVRIEMYGSHEMLIENFKGIMQYEQDVIKVSAGKSVIVLKGSGLDIKNMNDSGLVIGGNIKSVEFLS